MNFINNTDHYDQHFLNDEKVIRKFINECALSSFMEVVEVGPGTGTLTCFIAPKVKKITCIELDVRLEKYLKQLKEKFKNLEIIFGNVLNIFIPKCDKIISALPYSITEPFIYKLIKCDFKEAILIVGNKFANNILSENSTRLSILTNCFFKCEKIIEISKEAFSPPPRVISAIIKLKPISSEDLIDRPKMFIFRESFFYNKKKIKNVFVEAFIRYKKLHNMTFTKNESRHIIKKLEINQKILDKTIDACSNQDIADLNNSLKKLENFL